MPGAPGIPPNRAAAGGSSTTCKPAGVLITQPADEPTPCTWNTLTTEVTQLPDGPATVAARTSPATPTATMITGSRAAATTGHQNATASASTNASTVQACTPNSTSATAVTGISSRPSPNRRSTWEIVR